MTPFHPSEQFDQATMPSVTMQTGQQQILSLDENQLRWALWAAMVAIFGCPQSNAMELLFELKPQRGGAIMWEAQFLLTQIATKFRDDPRVEEFRLSMEKALANPECN